MCPTFVIILMLFFHLSSCSPSDSAGSSSASLPAYPTLASDPNPDEHKLECRREGFFADRSNCRRFIHCESNGRGAFERRILECPEGTIFNRHSHSCAAMTARQQIRCNAISARPHLAHRNTVTRLPHRTHPSSDSTSSRIRHVNRRTPSLTSGGHVRPTHPSNDSPIIPFAGRSKRSVRSPWPTARSFRVARSNRSRLREQLDANREKSDSLWDLFVSGNQSSLSTTTSSSIESATLVDTTKVIVPTITDTNISIDETDAVISTTTASANDLDVLNTNSVSTLNDSFEAPSTITVKPPSTNDVYLTTPFPSVEVHDTVSSTELSNKADDEERTITATNESTTTAIEPKATMEAFAISETTTERWLEKDTTQTESTHFISSNTLTAAPPVPSTTARDIELSCDHESAQGNLKSRPTNSTVDLKSESIVKNVDGEENKATSSPTSDKFGQIKVSASKRNRTSVLRPHPSIATDISGNGKITELDTPIENNLFDLRRKTINVNNDHFRPSTRHRPHSSHHGIKTPIYRFRPHTTHTKQRHRNRPIRVRISSLPINRDPLSIRGAFRRRNRPIPTNRFGSVNKSSKRPQRTRKMNANHLWQRLIARHFRDILQHLPHKHAFVHDFHNLMRENNEPDVMANHFDSVDVIEEEALPAQSSAFVSESPQLEQVASEQALCNGQPFVRSPIDCNRFVRCMTTGQLWISPVEFHCAPGLVFDEQLHVCTWPHLSSPCLTSALSSNSDELRWKSISTEASNTSPSASNLQNDGNTPNPTGATSIDQWSGASTKASESINRLSLTPIQSNTPKASLLSVKSPLSLDTSHVTSDLYINSQLLSPFFTRQLNDMLAIDPELPFDLEEAPSSQPTPWTHLI